MKKIYTIADPDLSSNYHRIQLPFDYLQQEGKTIITHDIKDADVVCFNRFPGMHLSDFFSLKRKYGFKTIMDIDDYWRKPLLPFSVFKGFQIEQLIRNSDYITTTTEILYHRIRQINKNVLIIPNALPFEDGQFHADRSVSDEVRFIYTGSYHNHHNIELLDALKNLNICFSAVDFGDKMQKRPLEEIFPLKLSVKINKLPHDSYMNIYNDADCLIVPMKNTPFNQCKSNLKTLEAGCKQIPVIASKTLPYYNERDKAFIDFAENNTEWYNIVKYYQENKNYVTEKGERLAEHVRQRYNLFTVNHLRSDLINNL